MSFTSWEEKDDKPLIERGSLIDAMVSLSLPGMTWIEQKNQDKNAPSYGLLFDGDDYYVFQSNKKLGEGASGTVYQGWKLEGKDRFIPCAVKEIPVSSRSRDISTKEYIKVSKREAEHLKKISPGQASAIITPQYLYMVQPLAKGEPIVDDFGRPHPKLKDLNFSQKTELVTEILKQLKKIHDHDLVHGDIKNQNILFFLDKHGKFHVSLIDFGNSQELKGAESVTRALASPGSPGYIPPERKKGVFAKGSDIFAMRTVILSIYGEKFLENSDFSKKAKEVLQLSLDLHLNKMAADNLKERYTVDQAIQYFETFNRVLENYSSRKSVLQSRSFWTKMTTDDLEILKTAANEEKFDLFSNKI